MRRRLLLVQMRLSNGTARFGLLETVRQYSQQKLREAGEEAALQRRHADWCVALAEEAFPELQGGRQVQWLDRLEEEHDNFRAALRWCVAGRQTEQGLRLGGALWRFWAYRGYNTEAGGWLALVLALPLAKGAARLLALMGAGTMAYHSGETTLALARFQELRRLSAECGDWRRLAAALTQLGSLAMQDNDTEAAHGLHTEALTIRQQHGLPWDTVISWSHLAQLDLRRGDYVGARRKWSDALTTAREVNDIVEVAACLHGLAEVDLAEGNLSASHTQLQEGLSFYRTVQHREGISMMLETFAQLAHADGRPDFAVRLFGAVAKLREGFGIHVKDARLSEHIAAARRAAGESVAADAWAAGYAIPADQAIDEALSLVVTKPR